MRLPTMPLANQSDFSVSVVYSLLKCQPHASIWIRIWTFFSTFTRGLLSELQRRFPTTQHSSASTSSSATSSNRGRSQRVGRPSNESVIKDIVIVGLQCEKTPTTRQEKISHQHRNRVISRFTIEKGWNEKTLYDRVKAQLPEDCKGIEFEFMKNVSGALMRPTLASGVRVNGNILLKSISSTGAVYV